MGHIFVSYSRQDQETVDRIIEAIKRAGRDVWIDREKLKEGELWRASVVQAIDDADLFLIMLSPNSATSKMVQKEIDLAEGANIDLVSVVLAPLQIPAQLRYQLAGSPLVEYYKDPEAKLSELVNMLSKHETKRASEASNRQAELVIQGIDMNKFGAAEQEKLLAFLAEITSAPRGEIHIASLVTAAGTLAGDFTTDAPPPDVRKKKKKTGK